VDRFDHSKAIAQSGKNLTRTRLFPEPIRKSPWRRAFADRTANHQPDSTALSAYYLATFSLPRLKRDANISSRWC
jgi:hypothetical protein